MDMGAQSNPLLDLSARPIIAHRGASGSAPENTLAAFNLAVRQGADAIELDVRLTADGVPVVLHDATLDRTTASVGPLGALSFAGLQAVDAGARYTPDQGRTYPYRGTALRVPALADVLREFSRIPILVEVKEPAAQEAVRRVILDQDAA
jgi:glycerophosphoryl diester phosphodiesterase